MKRSGIAGFALIALMAGCGNGGGLRYYRGTQTATSTEGTNTTVSTTSGALITTLPSSDGSQWLYLISSLEFEATLAGTALSFASGQDISSTSMSGAFTSMSMASLSTGSGSMTPTNLTLNLTLTGTQTQGTSTVNETSTVVFNGTRE